MHKVYTNTLSLQGRVHHGRKRREDVRVVSDAQSVHMHPRLTRQGAPRTQAPRGTKQFLMHKVYTNTLSLEGMVPHGRRRRADVLGVAATSGISGAGEGPVGIQHPPSKTGQEPDF